MKHKSVKIVRKEFRKSGMYSNAEWCANMERVMGASLVPSKAGK
jgi:hypothetical protein